MSLFEGQNLKGRAINVKLGFDGQRRRARWDMEVVEGEHKGKTAKYSGKLDADHIKFTKRDMKTIGWKGEKSSTFASDVKAAGLIVEFTAEIAEHDGRRWVAAKF